MTPRALGIEFRIENDTKPTRTLSHEMRLYKSAGLNSMINATVISTSSSPMNAGSYVASEHFAHRFVTSL